MLISEPVLSGDLVEMTEQYTKWSVEIRHASDIPVAIRRAFKEAKTPPTGPVFVSFPWDTLDEEVDFEAVASSEGFFRIRPDAAAVARATELLASAENPVIVVGDRVAQSGAVEQVARVAEQTRRAGGGYVLFRGELSDQPSAVGRDAEPEQPGHGAAV